MIRGRCRTNLDEGKRYQWPTVFVAVPRIGERVMAVNSAGGPCSCLKVYSIIHYVVEKYNEFEGSTDVIPMIEVELNT